ncbi:hypothetical protein Tco_1384387 [Tanacetum coccineum]
MTSHRFDWNVRKEGSEYDPLTQYGKNIMHFHVSLNFVRGFKEVSYVDVVDIDEFCLHDLKEMVVKLGYGVADLMYYHFLRPKEESDEKGGSEVDDSDDLDYDPKDDERFDDDEHILEDVLVSMNSYNFNPDTKHDLSIVVTEVHEHDLDVIDYDTFSSDLDEGIDLR